jgi:membrane-associated phospholipid phosphatase
MITIRQTLMISLFLIFISESSLSGQNKYNFSEFIHETPDFIKAPAYWNAGDWIKLGIVSGGTFLVYQFDQQIRDQALEIHRIHPTYRKSTVITVGDEWGGFFFGPALSVALYTTGCLVKSNKTKKIGFEIAQAMLYSEVISFTSKVIIGRSRPFTGRGRNFFKPFTVNSPSNSFPAGHIAAAFALSSVLEKNTNSTILKVAAYIPASLTVISRVYSDSHWASDVFIGSALGYFVGTWVVNNHESKDSPVKISSIYPLYITISLN